MAKTIHDAVREVCLSFPEAEEDKAHGSPTFSVRGKTFAMYTVNHHGDGRVSLWLNSPPGAQDVHVRGEPKHFFVPPYVGPRGWLGVQLDKGLSWKRIALLVREAYEKLAPPALRATLGKTIEITPPKGKLTPEQLDPMKSARAQRLLKALRKICLAWPETSEDLQFGAPVWRAGKKSFALAYFRGAPLKTSFWVGVDRQGLLTSDERFTIPMYMGHNGWIELDVARGFDESELRQLALDSYRHFANKRMLTALGTPRAEKPSRSKRKS
ncbi:MAG: MmcQ/YjbR family DNA-binding protein [Gammaproteobacteria bacterium]